MTRYSRHLIIPEIGEKGQIKLLDAGVLMLGAGGLGSPAALYLAAAGVGKIGIIDSDVVDRSNLQRQVLHTDDRVGESKVESARQTLKALNPDIEILAVASNRENIPKLRRAGADNVISPAAIAAKQLAESALGTDSGTVFDPQNGQRGDGTDTSS
jgi:molybdopterin/thiamine biosynthesis adenylyltransferase